MYFMRFQDRGSPTSKHLNIPTTTTIATTINIMIATIAMCFISTRARVVTGTSPFSGQPEKLLVVEELKRRFREQMGHSSPPSLSGTFKNMTQLRERYRNEIEEFSQKMQLRDNHRTRRFDQSPSYVTSKVFVLQPQSPNQPLNIHIRKGSNHPRLTSTTIHFTTPSSLDTDQRFTKPTLDSVVLRIAIKRHRLRLRHHLASTKPRVNITVSLLHQHTISGTKTPSSTLLKSFLVDPYQMPDVIELNDIKNYFPSTLADFQSDHIAFEVSATEIASSGQDDLGRSMMGLYPIKYRHRNRGKISSRRRFLSSYRLSSRSYITMTPTLEVKISQKDGRKRRSRRSVNDECNGTNLCCRQSIYISFADVGMEWVLFPEGFTAYYCKGSCQKRFYKNAAVFSNIKVLLHEKDPNLIPAPTCAASGYDSISLLCEGENGIPVTISYQDMIVTDCKCY